MKRSVTSAAIAISLLTLLSLGIAFYNGIVNVPIARAKPASQNCSLSRMEGSYGYTLTGCTQGLLP
jgi:cyanate permease